MNGESNYESDISESWSLIDINLNEESVSAAEVQSILESSPSDLKNVKLKKRKSLELKSKDSDESQTALNLLGESNNDLHCLKREDGSSEEEKCEEINKTDSEDGSKNESGDTESIEILDIDGNYRDTDIKNFDILFVGNSNNETYHSEDEESFYEKNIDDADDMSCSTVIKRKRRKLSRSSESSKESVNSDSMSSKEKYYSNVYPGKTKESKDDLEVLSYELNSRPVYKHYRNNVANTILSVSMGVIFAGVACIAIGHFLGVHDAGETAVELMETVKKLQMKNVVLQSRLNHLNRAFITLDANSKQEATLHELMKKHQIDNLKDSEPEKKLKSETLSLQSDIDTTSNSMDWVSRLQNLVQTKSNYLNKENGIDLNKVVDNIHDQLAFLNSHKTETAKLKYLEDSDSKISKILQKIISKLSTSQDNIEILYEKLVKLKNKLNKKLNKILSEKSYCEAGEKFQKQQKKKMPVTESDLFSIQWKPNKEAVVQPRNLVVFFPQPEEYYKTIEMNFLSKKNRSESTGDEGSKKKVQSVEDTQCVKKAQKINSNKIIFRDSKKEEKYNGKPEKIFKKSKEKKTKSLKQEKFSVEKRSKKLKKSFVDSKKKQDIFLEFKKKSHKLLKKNREGFNETNFPKKISDEIDKLKKELKAKRSLVKKKTKKTKIKRIFLSSLTQNPEFRQRNNRDSQKCIKRTVDDRFTKFQPKCFNLTGHWIFKWANGRQEFRRYQTLGDWQFDRAKGRKDLRNEDFSLNWQFKRALARENNRNDDRYGFKNNNRKEFFHEEFSWL